MKIRMDSFANIFSGAGREFKSITQKEINQVMDKLNNCTGKCLGIKTPNQVFLGINPFVALAS